VTEWRKYKNRFNGLTDAEACGRTAKRVRAETVETDSVCLDRSTTPLKRGVNETGIKLTKNFVAHPGTSEEEPAIDPER
jgi:hypothetical protein